MALPEYPRGAPERAATSEAVTINLFLVSHLSTRVLRMGTEMSQKAKIRDLGIKPYYPI